jgi:hypothetical protein
MQRRDLRGIGAGGGVGSEAGIDSTQLVDSAILPIASIIGFGGFSVQKSCTGQKSEKT